MAQGGGGPAVPMFAETAPNRLMKDMVLFEDVAYPCDLCKKAIVDIGFRCIKYSVLTLSRYSVLTFLRHSVLTS